MRIIPLAFRRRAVVRTAFAGLCLSAAVLALPSFATLDQTPIAAAEQKTLQPGELFVRPHATEPDTIMMFWAGKIVPGMADQIARAYEANRLQARRFVLVLASGGGSVREGERVIGALQQIKRTHRLDTQVRNGQMCGSMCVFVYVQGQVRFGGPSSVWLFHEVSLNDPKPDEPAIIDRAAWERLVVRYLAPAGVSPKWTDEMKPKTINANYWQTGIELFQLKAGIVTNLTPSAEPRLVTPASLKTEPPSAATANGPAKRG